MWKNLQANYFTGENIPRYGKWYTLKALIVVNIVNKSCAPDVL